MAKIDNFLPILFKVEGGLANDKADRGGKTKWGVTNSTFKSYYPGTSADVNSMTYDQCVKIYKTGYWDKCRADEINNQSVANLLVDFAVNCGPLVAIRKIQRIVGVTVDGFMGAVTLKAINGVSDQRMLFSSLKETRKKFYMSIVSGNKSQQKFLQGWLNRLGEYQYE